MMAQREGRHRWRERKAVDVARQLTRLWIDDQARNNAARIIDIVEAGNA
jgi:hypothetical protein